MISEKSNECIEKAIAIGSTLTKTIYKLALTTLPICTIHVHQQKAKLYMYVTSVRQKQIREEKWWSIKNSPLSDTELETFKYTMSLICIYLP